MTNRHRFGVGRRRVQLLQLAHDASQRLGVQPVVALTAHSKGNGDPGGVVNVKVGQPVTLQVKAQVPPGAGSIVKVEWDLQGNGTFTSVPQSHVGPTVVSSQTDTFNTPGTYFPVVRVTSQANGDPSTPFGLVQNLGSERVVVH
jgi:hypothetical protein